MGRRPNYNGRIRPAGALPGAFLAPVCALSIAWTSGAWQGELPSVADHPVIADLRVALELGEHQAVRADLPLLFEQFVAEQDRDAMAQLVSVAFAIGDFPTAIRACRWEVARLAPTDGLELMRARYRLAMMLWWQRVPECLPLMEELCQRAPATEGLPVLEQLEWRIGLSMTYLRAFRYAEVVELIEGVLAEAMELDVDPLLVARARGILAQALYYCVDARAALEHAEACYGMLRGVYRPEDPRLLEAQGVLAALLEDTGDIPGALGHRKAVLDACERTLPPEHPLRLQAMDSLAGILRAYGRGGEALDLIASVLATRVETLAPHDRELLRTQRNYAGLLRSRGLDDDALEVLEGVVATWTAEGGSDPVEFALAQNELGVLLSLRGESERARTLRDSSFRYLGEVLPPTHPVLLDVRRDLAKFHEHRGDYLGSRIHLEALLEALEKTLPEDHPSLLGARQNLAVALAKLGDFEAALPLDQAVLSASERTLPEGHPDLSAARLNLASTMMDLGRTRESRPLLEQVVSTFEQQLPADHRNLALARTNLGGNLVLLGELDSATELLELAIAAYEKSPFPDEPDLPGARRNLAEAYRGTGDIPAAGRQARLLADGLRRRLAASLHLSARQARSAAAIEEANLVFLMNCALELEDDALSRATFELIETQRVVATASSAREYARLDDELGRWLDEAHGLRERVAALASGWRDPTDERSVPDQLRDAASERDRLETRCRERVSELGGLPEGLEADAIAAALPAGAAAVGYRRYRRTRVDAGSHYLAHVLLSGGGVRRLELGAAEPIEAEIAAWREAIGAPTGTSRGVGRMVLGVDSKRTTSELGDGLRRRLLDPVLEAVSGAVPGAVDGPSRLYVCLDGALHLLPLDALPARSGDGRTTGDRTEFVVVPSLAELLRGRPHAPADGAWLGLGDIEYGAQGTPPAFPPLPGTLSELTTISALFTSSFPDAPCEVLRGSEATKDALAERVHSVRYLHLATHGWFAGDGTDGSGDGAAPGGVWRPMSPDVTLANIAPMALCGLALAGANGGEGSLPSSIVTGEELAAYDLSRCDLAVLSACDTNAGLERAGQGILSLQAALHEAGARTAITSLWDVDDAATSRLMSAFYDGMWSRGLSKAGALRSAKQALREEGTRTREWAAWVLSGSAD